MAQAVTLMMASLGCCIFGSGTVSQRISPLPCQQSAFIGSFSSLVASDGEDRVNGRAVSRKGRKDFFFEKKKQKIFGCGHAR
jgi:hypothetical protein